MRPLLAVLTCLMLFTTPVVAGDTDDEAIQEALEIGKARLAYLAAQDAFDERHFLKAFRLYKPLAEKGNVVAQLNLGWMYRNGRGIPEQDVKAFNWYRKAAERGNAKAQYALGQMYANGEGVPENYVESYAWLSIAATQGEYDVWINKGIVEERMTSNEIAKAQALSAEYWKKYVVPFQNN